ADHRRHARDADRDPRRRLRQPRGTGDRTRRPTRKPHPRRPDLQRGLRCPESLSTTPLVPARATPRRPAPDAGPGPITRPSWTTPRDGQALSMADEIARGLDGDFG